MHWLSVVLVASKSRRKTQFCQVVSLPVRRLFAFMVFNVVCMILGNHCTYRTVMKVVSSRIS